MPETESKVAAKAPTKARNTVAKKKPSQRKKASTTTRPDTKAAKIIALLKRPSGASLKELMAATGWQRHSVHGFLSGAIKKKLGLKLDSLERGNGQRAYRVAPSK